MPKTLQTLEDLRHAKVAAWLWDTRRSRLVWANTAGITAFEAGSLYELIERPFDAAEPAMQAVAELQKDLPRGLERELQLAFPSVGMTEPAPYVCRRHNLADGREGMLVIEKSVASQTATVQADFVEEWPVASFAIDAKGQVVFANAMARDLFDVGATPSLAALVQPATLADSLLQRLQHARLVSQVMGYHSAFGLREARITLRRPTTETGQVFALAVMEDVTDRRSLEQNAGLAEKPVQAETLPAPEREAFEDLGRTLVEATKIAPLQKPTPKPMPVPALRIEAPADSEPAKAIGAGIPPAIIAALEKNPSALIIARNGAPLYVSPRLPQLLGHQDVASLSSDADFWAALAVFKPVAPAMEATLNLGDMTGKPTHFRVRQTQVPWQNGAAQQLSFDPVPTVLPLSKTSVKPLAQPSVHLVETSEENVTAPPQAQRSKEGETSAQDLQSILDISSDGIITMDQAANIKSFSAGAEAIFGLRSAEVLDSDFSKLLSPESATVFRDYLAGLAGQSLASVFNDGREVKGFAKSGGEIPLFLNIGRLSHASGTPVFCAVLRDITSWKRTETELRAAKEAAETASHHKSEFLARVSHELRTPLNAIIGFSEIMRNGRHGDIANEKFRGYVNDIHVSGGQLLSMINDLLDMSKIESGRMDLNFTSVSLTDCFEQAQRMLQDQAAKARVVIRKSFPANLPRVVADHRAIRQIMQNLLSNAIKYTDAGGQVIASAKMSATGALSFRIQDTGIGMAVAELDRALQPFMRVDTPGRERQGTGLGLPLSKALAEANRAEFAITSETGKGTAVEVTFPTTRVLAE